MNAFTTELGKRDRELYQPAVNPDIGVERDRDRDVLQPNSGVGKYVEQLDLALGHLDRKIDELRVNLTPVLQPERSSDPSEATRVAEKPEYLSGLAQQLKFQTDRANQLADTIQRLMEHLDI